MITGDFFYLRESSTVFDVIDNIITETSLFYSRCK